MRSHPKMHHGRHLSKAAGIEIPARIGEVGVVEGVERFQTQFKTLVPLRTEE